jgi:phospholipase/carboxylesterase
MATLEQRNYAGSECYTIMTEGPPEFVAVFCHGFGAPGDDLVPLGASLLQSAPELLDRVQFVFPPAPLKVEDFGRAWWPLSMARLAQAVQDGPGENWRNEIPDQLDAARKHLIAILQAIASETGLPFSKVVLGGFSQGAMLAMDVALHLDTPLAGLVLWSGTLLNEVEWTQRTSVLKDLPVMQSHGRQDPVLPFEAAIWLRDFLVSAGTDLTFIPFRDGHTIPVEALGAAAHLIESLLPES